MVESGDRGADRARGIGRMKTISRPMPTQKRNLVSAPLSNQALGTVAHLDPASPRPLRSFPEDGQPPWRAQAANIKLGPPQVRAKRELNDEPAATRSSFGPSHPYALAQPPQQLVPLPPSSLATPPSRIPRPRSLSSSSSLRQEYGLAITASPAAPTSPTSPTTSSIVDLYGRGDAASIMQRNKYEGDGFGAGWRRGAPLPVRKESLEDSGRRPSASDESSSSTNPTALWTGNTHGSTTTSTNSKPTSAGKSYDEATELFSRGESAQGALRAMMAGLSVAGSTSTSSRDITHPFATLRDPFPPPVPRIRTPVTPIPPPPPASSSSLGGPQQYPPQPKITHGVGSDVQLRLPRSGWDSDEEVIADGKEEKKARTLFGKRGKDEAKRSRSRSRSSASDPGRSGRRFRHSEVRLPEVGALMAGAPRFSYGTVMVDLLRVQESVSEVSSNIFALHCGRC